MRRVAPLSVLVGLLALLFAPAAHAVPEAGTLELVGLITYSQNGGTSDLRFSPSTCVHSRTPNSTDVAEVGNAAGWTCNGAFSLGGTAPRLGFFDLTGSWSTSYRSYSMRFSLPDLLVAVGANVATGTVSEGGRTGPATLTFVTTPHADATKSGLVGTIQYALS